MLAKGNDAHLKAAADRELAQPTTAEAQMQAGNAWWDAAQQQNSAAKRWYRSRARFWYQQASQHITGLNKTLVEKRIIESFGAPDDAVMLGGHCYLFSNTVLRWHEAKVLCELLHGHLACIESNEEQKVVVQYLHDRPSWLGGTDEDVEGQWKWVNGSPFTYTSWGSGQPDNAGGVENWLHTYGSGIWNDTSEGITYSFGFLCEWE